MKYFILLLLLTSCVEPIKPRDCVVNGRYKLLRIIKVGTHGGYMVQDENCYLYNWHSLAGGLTLTDCFDTFDKCDKVWRMPK